MRIPEDVWRGDINLRSTKTVVGYTYFWCDKVVIIGVEEDRSSKVFYEELDQV